jgi:hypothetical protein
MGGGRLRLLSWLPDAHHEVPGDRRNPPCDLHRHHRVESRSGDRPWPPSEDAMDEQARQQAFVSALVTEHFVLQSALLMQWVAGIGAAGAGLVGVVATLVVFGLHLVWESRWGDAVLGWRVAARRARGGLR